MKNFVLSSLNLSTTYIQLFYSLSSDIIIGFQTVIFFVILNTIFNI